MSQDFWEQYSAFSKTSRAGPAARLQFRYKMLLGDNPSIFEGKRVIDLASHDGRWSFCALKHGAKYVLGVEARESTGARGIENFDLYGIERSRYRFLFGDLFRILPELDETEQNFDLGLCLGFLYHTARHFEVISHLRRLGCRTLLVETNILPEERPIVQYRLESVALDHNAYSEDGVHDLKTLSALPTTDAVLLLLESFGYRARVLPVPDLPPEAASGEEDWAPDFRRGRRVAIIGEL